MYDVETLREIPIKDICSVYGIELSKKGNNLWGKIREEKTPSFSVNPDKNIWRDWGLSTGGDVISLVAELENVKYGKAIGILGDKFNINKLEVTDKYNNLPTKNQFKKIGIMSQRVISNMDINLEKQSFEQLEQLEKKYSISMYDLSKEDKNLYHNLIDKKALPLIYNDRSFFIDMSKRYKEQITSIDKQMYKYILEDLQDSFNEKIDIYNKARLDDINKDYLKLNVEAILLDKEEIDMSTEETFNRYYLTQRPPSIGTHPKNALNVVAFESKKVFEGVDCWGYVEYEKPLTENQKEDYELLEKVKVPIIDMAVNKDIDVIDIMTNLKNGVGNIFNNENFIQYLNFQSKFYSYSPNNNILIALQNPKASQVASFTKWKALGRSVNKGEKGIVILAPNVVSFGPKQIIDKLENDNSIRVGKYLFIKQDNNYRISSNGKTIKTNLSKNELQSFIKINNLKAQMIVGFKKTYVFDINQTNGKEIPQFKLDKLNDNDLLTKHGYYKMPYVKIDWSESNFKKGQILPLPEANKLFKEREAEVRNLKSEYSSKGKYYPYEKTKFTIHLSPHHKSVFRYDIGDSYSNDLCSFLQKELIKNKDMLDKLSEPLGIENLDNIEWIGKIKDNIDLIKNLTIDYISTYEKLYKDDPDYQNETKILLSKNGEVHHITHKNYEEVEKQLDEGSCISLATLSNPFNESQFDQCIKNTISNLENTISYNPKHDRSMGTILAIKLEIENCINNKSINLEYTTDTGTANGYFSPLNNKICVNPSMSLSQSTKTLIHEYVHSQLHKDGIEIKDNLNDIQTAEVEAEATTYVVAKYFGFDTSEYSFDYVSSWARGNDINTLEETLKTIKVTSEKIINEIKNPLELQLYNNKENILGILKSENINPSEKIINNMLDINKETGKINTISDLKAAEKYKCYGDTQLSSKIASTNKNLIDDTIIIEKTYIEIER